jgi:outer membrane protein assembly factor BamE (lipoprotein component of BamABCDE complex)
VNSGKLMSRFLAPVLCAASLLLGGCQSATEHASQVHQAEDAGSRMTVGQVQREIHVEMSSADVVGVLGSPNMVTTDELRREVWVYDKVATESVSSGSSGGLNALIFGGFHSGAGASSTSQRTLTVVIKFDQNARVRDFSYRSSSF